METLSWLVAEILKDYPAQPWGITEISRTGDNTYFVDIYAPPGMVYFINPKYVEFFKYE